MRCNCVVVKKDKFNEDMNLSGCGRYDGKRGIGTLRGEGYSEKGGICLKTRLD